MDSIVSIIEENKKLLDGLYKVDEEVMPEAVSTVDIFRGKLLGFINNALSRVKRSEQLLDLVDAEIVKKLCLHEYDKNELMELRASLVNSTNMKTAVLLDPFKPTNGGGNSLITPPSNKDEDVDSILKSISPEQRQALTKLNDLLHIAETRRERVIKEEEE